MGKILHQIERNFVSYKEYFCLTLFESASVRTYDKIYIEYVLEFFDDYYYLLVSFYNTFHTEVISMKFLLHYYCVYYLGLDLSMFVSENMKYSFEIMIKDSMKIYFYRYYNIWSRSLLIFKLCNKLLVLEIVLKYFYCGVDHYRPLKCVFFRLRWPVCSNSKIKYTVLYIMSKPDQLFN